LSYNNNNDNNVGALWVDRGRTVIDIPYCEIQGGDHPKCLTLKFDTEFDHVTPGVLLYRYYKYSRLSGHSLTG